MTTDIHKLLFLSGCLERALFLYRIGGLHIFEPIRRVLFLCNIIASRRSAASVREDFYVTDKKFNNHA